MDFQKKFGKRLFFAAFVKYGGQKTRGSTSTKILTGNFSQHSSKLGNWNFKVGLDSLVVCGLFKTWEHSGKSMVVTSSMK